MAQSPVCGALRRLRPHGVGPSSRGSAGVGWYLFKHSHLGKRTQPRLHLRIHSLHPRRPDAYKPSITSSAPACHFPHARSHAVAADPLHPPETIAVTSRSKPRTSAVNASATRPINAAQSCTAATSANIGESGRSHPLPQTGRLRPPLLVSRTLPGQRAIRSRFPEAAGPGPAPGESLQVKMHPKGLIDLHHDLRRYPTEDRPDPFDS